MPHATEDESLPLRDETADLASFFSGGNLGGDAGEDLWNNLGSGEKADDAIDYEDFSDEELPDEEEATNRLEDDGEVIQKMLENGFAPAGNGPNGTEAFGDVNGYQQDEDMEDAKPMGGLFGDGEEDNDLFGERMSSSPVAERKPDFAPQEQQPQRQNGLALPGKVSGGLALPRPGAPARPLPRAQFQASPTSMSPTSFAGDALSPVASSSPESDDEMDESTRLQMELFRAHKDGRAYEIPTGRSLAELRALFPTWEPDEVPKFTEIFAPLPGKYKGKIPVKPPKPVQPTKLSLDILPDQERSFRSLTVPGKTAQDAFAGRNLIFCDKGTASQDDSDDDLALSNFDETEVIGGVTMQDLAVICEDWDIPSIDSGSVTADEEPDIDGEWETEERARPQKRRRVGILDTNVSITMQDAYLRFEDPEEATARVAQAVTLDMNDPLLLLDEQAPQTKRKVRRVPGDNTRDTALGRDLARRYNISNDEAYDLLKENHQHKVRSTLGNTTTEHSLPAIKLQYPFYKVGMDSKEKRAFHRQPFVLHENPGRTYRFSKPKFQKRKHVRGREAKELFAKTEDLSFGDNSSALLLEYSEEVPMMLSNFGMGNRLVNYYRKRDADDQERPKREIGETHVLLNQDKSPFNNFGYVDPGETVPTILNPLYRAPVFQHKPKSNDFILAISHTHEGGNRLFLRNVENLHAVGQQFPFLEIPGEHSRKVTDAAKKRLKAISFRIYAKTQDLTRRGGIALTNKVLMKHIPGSDIPQTRSKMREFMRYEKKAKNSDDDGYWVPMLGHMPPDTETIRGWIKPEDVCLLDSMQVGVQHLADLGITDSKDAKEDDEAEDDENIEKMLAPWRTTKNFIQATSGKAMLKIHGEGDPTGRGEAFSMLKTNMKGGYVPRGESAIDKMASAKAQQSSGHKYNVANQQAKYDRDIRDTWERQKAGLANDFEVSDTEVDDDDMRSETQGSTYPYGRGGTPRQSFGAGTPAFDDSASQFSKHSVDRTDEVLIIKRKHRDAYGAWIETPVRIDNPKVIKLYKKKVKERALARMNHTTLVPTGDPELDALAKEKIRAELARLERNQDRRLAREKLKARTALAHSSAASPSADAANSPAPSDVEGVDPSPGKPGKAGGPGKGRTKDGTARKCANCGQVGHIKTNRKSVSKPKFFCRCERPDFGLASEVVAAAAAGQKAAGRGKRGAGVGGPQDPFQGSAGAPLATTTGAAFATGRLGL